MAGQSVRKDASRDTSRVSLSVTCISWMKSIVQQYFSCKSRTSAIKFSMFLVIATVRSTREGTVFTGVCLSTSGGGGTYLPGGGGGGVPTLRSGRGVGVPTQVWVGGGGTYLSQVWMGGGVPTQVWTGRGTYLPRSGWGGGVTTQVWVGWGGTYLGRYPPT